MPSYKLYYYNGKGYAELSRYLFAYAGVEYEDVRFKDQEDFVKNYKPNFPTGRAPVLEVDGTKYPDSVAIARFLAREFNLYGAGNIEALQIDGVLETLNDIHLALLPIFQAKDEAKKAELKKLAVEEKIPATLTLLKKLLGGKDVFVGSSITYADIAFFRFMESALTNSATLLDNFPELKALKEKVAKEPKIAAWLAKRPDTPF